MRGNGLRRVKHAGAMRHPDQVPAVSNRSTNSSEKMTTSAVASNTREKSSCRKVGASDGGIETTPAIAHQSKRETDCGDDQDADQGAAQDLVIVQDHDDHEPREGENRRPFLQISERNQRRRMIDDDPRRLKRDDPQKQPDLAETASFRFFGMEVITYSRSLVTVMISASTPDRKTNASACQVYL